MDLYYECENMVLQNVYELIHFMIMNNKKSFYVNYNNYRGNEMSLYSYNINSIDDYQTILGDLERYELINEKSLLTKKQFSYILNKFFNNIPKENIIMEPKKILKDYTETVTIEPFNQRIIQQNIDNQEVNSIVLNVNKEEKEKNRRSIFENDKNNVYPLIYHEFIVTKSIDDFNKIPELFRAKFAIFLFLNGKNAEGVDVDLNLLESEDCYEVYCVLEDVIKDDRNELKLNEDMLKLLKEFIEFLPDEWVIFENCIPDSQYKILFETDEYMGEEDDTSLKANTFGI